MLPLELVAEPFALGNILMRRHAAIVWHRMRRVLDQAAVLKLLDHRRRGHRTGETFAHVIGRGRSDLEAQPNAMLDQLADRSSGPNFLFRQSVDFSITGVAENNLPLLVEEYDALRQVVDRAPKGLVLSAQPIPTRAGSRPPQPHRRRRLRCEQ